MAQTIVAHGLGDERRRVGGCVSPDVTIACEVSANVGAACDLGCVDDDSTTFHPTGL